MNQVNIPYLPTLNSQSLPQKVSLALDKLPKNAIGNVPWPQYPYKPDASFSIAYGDDCLALKYFVREQTAEAVYKKINEPVYRDSCVEFFISTGGYGYYNFEFNCAGACLVGFGPSKESRSFLTEQLIRKIRIHTTIQKGVAADDYWELCAIIPFDILSTDKRSISSQPSRVNFYKCGDDLPTPHFLCWNTIETPEPNFHLPEFFGYANFINPVIAS